MTEARRVHDDDTVVHPVFGEPAEAEDADLAAPAEDPYADEALADDDYLLLQPQKTSRLTIALVAVLILLLGFFAGVEVQKIFGGFQRPAGRTATASAAPSR